MIKAKPYFSALCRRRTDPLMSVLIRGPSVWIERLSSPINPLPFASPLLSQVAALRSYHTRVCGTDSAHLSSPFGSSTRPLSLCSLRSPRTLHADGAPLSPRVLPGQRRTLPVWYAELDPSRKLSPAGDTRLKAACLHSLSCEDKFTQRTPRYLRHYRCPSRNATFRSQNINTRRPMAYPRATSFWSQATQ